MDELIRDLEERKENLRLGGGPKRIERQHAKGRLTARERLDVFFDPETFVEIDLFARHRCTYFGMENREIPADAVVTGYGKVNGRLVFAYSEIGNPPHDKSIVNGYLTGDELKDVPWIYFDLIFTLYIVCTDIFS